MHTTSFGVAMIAVWRREGLMKKKKGKPIESAPTEDIKGRVESLGPVYNGGWRFGQISGGRKIVGTLPLDLQVGDSCTFRGHWVTNPKYGQQFQVDSVIGEAPQGTVGLKNYLAKHFDWVGPVVATELIKTFGEGLFDVILNEPQKLTAVNGITAGRAKDIRETYLSIQNDREHDLFFASHGITASMVNRLLEAYRHKDKAVKEIRKNPYVLAEKVHGIGFKTADSIAMSMGIDLNDPFRVRAGLIWCLKSAATGEGHVCLQYGDLLRRATETLEISVESVRRMTEQCIKLGLIVQDDGWLYYRHYYEREAIVAHKLRSMASHAFEPLPCYASKDKMEELGEDQLRGLEHARENRLAIITGGPGTGKTFLIKAVLAALGPERRIALAAPTGKAAKRMTEATGRPATTIHRLLGYNMSSGFPEFTYRAGFPLPHDTVIIDESSMIDVELMSALVDAFGDKTQAIFVGDVDQLPSVGPGRVFASMIDSESIPVARLTVIRRQEEGSRINVNAQRINSGEDIDVLPDYKSTDFWFLPEEDPEKIKDLVIKVCTRLPSQFPQFTTASLQVLCPQKKGPVGTIELNSSLSAVLNPRGSTIKNKSGAPIPFRTGDRVIQMKNDYNLEIFNGDIGVVRGTSPEDANVLLVEFDDVSGPRIVPIDILSKLENLQLAYALTVHKSQGSEFPVVVMPIHTTNHIMLKRNLLYTAVTRAKMLMILVGTAKAYRTAIRTLDSTLRGSNLAHFIRDGESQMEDLPEVWLDEPGRQSLNGQPDPIMEGQDAPVAVAAPVADSPDFMSDPGPPIDDEYITFCMEGDIDDSCPPPF